MSKKPREKIFNRIDKRIDECLKEKNFEEAAQLAVVGAFLMIPPEEIVKVLMDAVKKFKEEKKNATVQT